MAVLGGGLANRSEVISSGYTARWGRASGRPGRAGALVSRPWDAGGVVAVWSAWLPGLALTSGVHRSLLSEYGTG